MPYFTGLLYHKFSEPVDESAGAEPESQTWYLSPDVSDVSYSVRHRQ
jgi:hypothetical protein